MKHPIHVRPSIWVMMTFLLIFLRGPTLAQDNSRVFFDPEHQPPVIFKKDGLTVRVKASGTRRSLSVRKHGTLPHTVLLPVQFNQVNEIREGPKDRLIVVGMYGGYVWEIGILSLKPLSLVDHFTCFSPSVSSDGRYVAFVKFFPPHFVKGPEDHEMLYFVGRSARENRPSAIMLSDTVNVGEPVYPPRIGNANFDNINRPTGTEHRFAGANFFWSPDSSQFVFADSTAKNIFLVRVILNKEMRVSRFPISYGSVCPAKKGKPICQVQLSKVIYDVSHGRLSAEFNGYGIRQSLQQQLTVTFQQFEPVKDSAALQ